MTQTGHTPPVPPPPSSATQGNGGKKGIPLWGWIGIGCGCLVMLAVLAFVGLVIFGGKKIADFAEELENNPAAAVELAVKLNPEMELVETDTEARKITVRNKQTGEVATFDFSDIENGNFSFEGADGSNFTVKGSEGKVESTDADGETSTFGAGQSVENLPSWLRLYPDSAVQVGFTQKSEGQATGLLTQTTDDSMSDVADHFEDYFKSQGWKTSRSQMTMGTQEVLVVSGNSEDGTYSQAVQVTQGDGDTTQLSMQYTGPGGE